MVRQILRLTSQNSMTKKSSLQLILLISILALNLSSVALADFTPVPIQVNLPGQNSGEVAKTGPIGFVQQFYNFGLMIGGVLAFGAIVYGGIKYTFAAGNPSGQSEGKDWIKSALLGLLLLALATLLLRTINPTLATPTLPSF